MKNAEFKFIELFYCCFNQDSDSELYPIDNYTAEVFVVPVYKNMMLN